VAELARPFALEPMVVIDVRIDSSALSSAVAIRPSSSRVVMPLR
jgi:hypothetical protein